MDLKQFRYVLKVAELQSITKAASELYISQPSLSSYITKIEGQLGTQIFDRTTNPISITLAGEIYIETARKILALNQNLKEEIVDISNFNKGRITVGIPPSRTAYMLPFVLPSFNKLYPNIEIKTVEGKSEYIEDSLLKGRVDFAILPLSAKNKEKNEELEYEVIYEEQLLLVSSKEMLDKSYFSEEKIINIKKLNELPFILLNRGHGIRYALEELFHEYGFKPKVLLETTSNETAYRLATAGMGLAIVPEISVHLFKSINEPNLFMLSKSGIKWEVAIVYRKSDYINSPKKKFFEILKEKFPCNSIQSNYFDMQFIKE